ncbi:MAG: type IV pilus modification protein PilV [Rhizobium sp.]|nr:type IV pilus modification protein PilV [Rhizobium sp.]
MQASTTHRGRATRQSGASLLEVLVSVLILAIGLLGIAALQSITLKNTQSSSERTAAIIQSYAMFDMMRANRDAARAGNYNQGLLCEAPASPAASRVAGDLDRWIAQLKQSMGDSACGSITCGAQTCTVTVQWDDSRASDGDAEQKIITTTRL